MPSPKVHPVKKAVHPEQPSFPVQRRSKTPIPFVEMKQMPPGMVAQRVHTHIG